VFCEVVYVLFAIVLSAPRITDSDYHLVFLNSYYMIIYNFNHPLTYILFVSPVKGICQGNI